jgi:hypothetical protein
MQPDGDKQGGQQVRRTYSAEAKVAAPMERNASSIYRILVVVGFIGLQASNT